MLETPALKAHLYAAVLPGEGVVLLSEDGPKALHGAAYEKIVPLIDGRRTADDIVDALAGEIDAARVYFVLGGMEKNGYLAAPSEGVEPSTAAYWHAVGVDPLAAQQALATARVAVITAGATDPEPLTRALAAADLEATEPDRAGLWLVVADDYLRPELGEINAAALRSGTPWLLMRSTGREQWLGPHFVPGETGCWCCLKRRLERNRVIHRFAAEKVGSFEPLVARGSLAATHAASCGLAAAAAAQILAGAPCGLKGQVLSLDLTIAATQVHRLTRNPTCQACGERPDLTPRPVELQSRAAAFRSDGGHRGVTPEATLAAYQHLVSPITGAVRVLQSATPADETVAHVFMAGSNAAKTLRNLNDLKRHLRSSAAGKGVSEIQAKVSALCEAIERYSGEATGDEITVQRAWKDWAPGEAIHPNTVMRYSDAQYAGRDVQNAKGLTFNFTPRPLPDDEVVDWTPVWSLTEGRHKHLATQLLYYGAGSPGGGDFHAMGCSNGCASGNTREEAILQGFFELVERDAVAIWWYNRLRRRGVRLEASSDPYLLQIDRHYRERHRRETWALDLTTDLGIPVFVAISRQLDGPDEQILFGLGCHFDAGIAVQRAYAEMNQMLGIARADHGLIEDPEAKRWLKEATLEGHPYLAPDPGQAPAQQSDFSIQHTGDFKRDIDRCVTILGRAGLEMLVLDQTRADVGMPVVKVVVPGLRHFWERLAPGRLYDVPLQMGWLQRPQDEADLNPVAMFI